ncbi:PE family protein, partial [Mycobacterium szulgai]|nr:PE family protein [Mycobacterium szulgai]
MSFVNVMPELVLAAAADVARIETTLTAANLAAAGPTAGLLAAGADEVSAAVAALFSAHAQAYQTLSAQATAFHRQLVNALTTGAASYAHAEATNVAQSLLTAINTPTEALLSRPLIGNGTAGAPGTGADGGLAGSCTATAAAADPAAQRTPA